MKRLSVAAVCVLGLAAGSVGQIGDPFEGLPFGKAPTVAENVQARAVGSHVQVTGGQEFHVAVELRIADGWVYYSPDPGPMVLGATLEVDADGLEVGTPLWGKDASKAVQIGDETIVNNVYTHKTIVYVPIRVPEGAAPGVREIVLTPGGQICKDVCIDLRGITAAVSLSVGASAEANPAWTAEIAAGLPDALTVEQLEAAHVRTEKQQTVRAVTAVATGRTVWWWLGLAVLAGVTLNIMPCVLPVIPLRILSIVAMAHDSRRRFVTLGLSFAGGMMLFFVGVAGVSLLLRLAADQTVNISDHFGYPVVRIALAMVLVALGVNLFGVFTVVVPSKVASIEGEAQREGHLKTVGMGLMMAVLATPCSFAYLLTAMAWAQVQPPLLGTLAILLVGVGMAAPHALLTAFPKLLEKLPRPGKWMELFKQAMGFALLLVAIWLVSTLSESVWGFWVLGWGVVLAFSLWMWGSWVRYDATLVRKVAVRGLAVLLAVAGAVWMLPAPAPTTASSVFEPFDEGRIAEGRKARRIVLVKVTAAWCLECKVIDYRVFRTPEIDRELRNRDVLAITADVTDRGSAASKWMREKVGGAPPQTIIYPSDGRPPIRMVGGFDKADLTRMLDQAASAPAGDP